jgi:hypothetical protein
MTSTTTEQATESTITIEEVEGTDLHLKYRGQHGAQPVYVQLDCDSATLSAAASGEIGSGIPMRAWHGRWQRWTIPALTAEAANGLLAEILPLAERIVAGYYCRWDGHNHVGRFDDDAAEASEGVSALCDRDWDGQTIEVWDACDWYGAAGGDDSQRSALGITAATTDDELVAIEEREEREAHPRLIEGLGRHLTMLRDEALYEDE